MASREIRHLSPDMQILFNRFYDRVRRDTWMLKNGISLILTCTYRSNQEQALLYAQGRTTPGHVVTNAKAGKSKHNITTASGAPYAEAFDIVPTRNGKIIWGVTGQGINDDPADDDKNDLELWQRIGAHGVAVGLKWYGTKGSPFIEFPHFQNPKV